MQKKSDFTINGKVFTVVTDVPENLCEQIGHSRASALLASFGIAHWVQAGVKRAFAIVAEPGKASEATISAAKALKASVEANEPLSIMDFVPAPRGEGKVIADFRAKWPQASQEKRLAFLKKKGLDESLAAGDVEDVLPAYVEWLESKDEDEL
jgi:hypothetical protein